MPFCRRRISWRPLGRRLCAGVTLIAYLCAALGVPLPAYASPCGGDSCCCPAETKSRHQCCCSTGEQEPGDADCCKNKHESSSQPPTKAKARCPYCDPQPEDVTPPDATNSKAPK